MALWRRHPPSDIHSQLRAARPEAPGSLVMRITRDVCNRPVAARLGRARIVIAMTATVVVMSIAASLGGVSYAAGAANSVADTLTGSGVTTTQSVTPQDNTYDDNDFLINATPATHNHVPSTGSVSGTVHVVGMKGYPFSVTMSYSISPATTGISVTFPTNPVPPGSASFIVYTTGVAAGTYIVTITGTGHGGVVRTSSFTLNVA
jgi:hypothetical protein